MSNIVKYPSSQSWTQPQSWPPQCSCGCNPCQCGGGWGGIGGLMQCWQDIAQFQQFLQCMLSQMGPIPLQGVTDGSDAKPGYIGEFITANATMSFAAGVSTTTTLSVVVMSPGDWDISTFCGVTTPFGLVYYVLSPIPAGMSNDMATQVGETSAVGVESLAYISGQPARGSFSVPTLLPFSVRVDQSNPAGLLAGQLQFHLQARRRR